MSATGDCFDNVAESFFASSRAEALGHLLARNLPPRYQADAANVRVEHARRHDRPHGPLAHMSAHASVVDVPSSPRRGPVALHDL